MKSFGRNILFSAALTIGASGLSAAPANGDWFEQWQRTKFGRSSPREEARQAAERASTAYRAEESRELSASEWSDYLADQRYRAKYGRPSPKEEQRLKAEQESTAFREETTPAPAPNANTFFEQRYKTKYGRKSPLQESREKGQNQ